MRSEGGVRKAPPIRGRRSEGTLAGRRRRLKSRLAQAGLGWTRLDERVFVYRYSGSMPPLYQPSLLDSGGAVGVSAMLKSLGAAETHAGTQRSALSQQSRGEYGDSAYGG